MSANSRKGYNGRWGFVDLSSRAVQIVDSDPEVERAFIGGRGLQTWLLAQRIKELGGPVRDPLGPENRIIIGCSAPNDTRIHTAGRGSASFFSPMTRSTAPLDDGLPPVHGLVTHSSLGGSLPNKLKKSGIDQLIIDGRAQTPVRIEVIDGEVRILDAEPDLFEEVGGQIFPLRSHAMDEALKEKVGDKRASSLYTGPAGWARVPYACLTSDLDRNFGRGGAGAVLAAKNLIAVSFAGSTSTTFHDEELFKQRMKDLDGAIKEAVADPQQTASFRPTTGTTWWLDRAYKGGYLGEEGGYLPWHNFDEGTLDEEDFAGVGTDALLEISGKYKICTRCREIICARLVKGEDGELYPRPEFETAALFINCGITDRQAMVDLNHLCNEVGVDTMSTGGVIASAMDLDGKGLLGMMSMSLPYGDAEAMADAIEAIAYAKEGLGELLGDTADGTARTVMERLGDDHREDVEWCMVMAYGGLGYAGIQPKAFPAMNACYATSNRGRGDHTYAWTVQVEEAGIVTTPEEIGPYVASSQWGKAVIDSLGICDFFAFDVTSDIFRDLLYAITGNRYTAPELVGCGRRTVNLERMLNAVQGRTRAYDGFTPPKLTVPLSRGPMAGRKVDQAFHDAILDAYYDAQEWTGGGDVDERIAKELGLEIAGV